MSRRDAWAIDAQWFLTCPDVQSLPIAEVGALMHLLCWCWLNDGCEVPGDDVSLGALSRLGGGWAASTLKARMGRFFRPTGRGTWLALELGRQKEQREELSRKRSRAGKRSAEARASKQATPVQQVSDTCSASVEQVLSRCPTAEGAPGPNPLPETLVTATERAGAGPGQAGTNPPAADANDCTPFGQTLAPVGVSPTGPDDALAEGPPPAGTPPPHPPYKRDSSSGEVLREGGGAGGGEARDLFGVPLGAPTAPREGKVRSEHLEAAHRVVDAYQEQVRPEHRRTQQADRNAAWWLANGWTEVDLLGCVGTYAGYCRRVQRDSQFRKSAANFFGRRDPVFKSYRDEGGKDAGAVHEADVGRVGADGRVRSGRDYSAFVQTFVLDAYPD